MLIINHLKKYQIANALVLFLFTSACERGIDTVSIHYKQRKPYYPPKDSIWSLSGEQLAHIYCQQCHQFPEPELLAAEQWQHSVLTHMGYRLGIWEVRGEPVRGLDMMEQYLVNQAEIYPEEPLISKDAWEKIQRYYLQNASPDSSRHTFPNSQTAQFNAQKVRLGEETPLLTMLNYDEQNGELHIGLRNNQWLVRQSDGKTKRWQTQGAPVVSLKDRKDNNSLMLSMGIMDPSNQTKGKIYKQYPDSLSTIVDQLRRPVHMLWHDLNEDGEEDLLICEFGHNLGQFSVVYFQKGKAWRKQSLLQEAGIRKSAIYDWNQDGKKDILLLLSQGDEKIVVLKNKGQGKYEEEVLLRFPPVYGSSYFELADFNKDGRKDILYVNGDNADYSYALKPYHGIRIYLNSKEEGIKETYFFPLYGATEARAYDFDEDGDLDIFGIAYFADFESTPASSAVYLENTSTPEALTFKPQAIAEAESGRWLTMEIADTDQDGDKDIILGSCVLVNTPLPDNLKKYWAEEGSSLLYLKNQIK